jgi:hypothetical protein
VSLPRTATAVTPALEMALKAYSDRVRRATESFLKVTHQLDTAAKDKVISW